MGETPPRCRASWSDHDKSLLRIEFEQGESLNELADLLDRTPAAVQHQLIRMGLVKSEPLESVRERAPRHGEPWSDNERRQVADLATQGFAPAEIAHHLGRSETSIRFELERH